MENCAEINEMISLYIDGLLNESESAAFEKHIGECAACREEYLETKKAVEIVAYMEEEELPEGFAEELHGKLLQEKAKMDHKKNYLILLNRALKVTGTVAAILILTFIFKGMLGNFSAGKDSSRASGTALAGSVSKSAAAHAEAGAAANASPEVPKQENSFASTYGESILPNGVLGGEKGMSETAAAAENGAASYDINSKAKQIVPEEHKETRQLTKKDFTIATVDLGNESLHYANMAIRVANPVSEKVNIQSLLQNMGAEILPQGTVTDTVVTIYNYVNKAESDSLTISFRISNDHFDAMLASLKSKWGDKAIQMESQGEVQIGDQIKQLEQQLAELKKKAQANTDTKSGAITLQAEINKTQVTLDALRKDIGFTTGTLIIKKT